MKDGIRQTIGKRIFGIIVTENYNTPHRQVFLIFDDNTYFEFYGNEFSEASGLNQGNTARVVASIKQNKEAQIKAVYPETLLTVPMENP